MLSSDVRKSHALRFNNNLFDEARRSRRLQEIKQNTSPLPSELNAKITKYKNNLEVLNSGDSPNKTSVVEFTENVDPFINPLAAFVCACSVKLEFSSMVWWFTIFLRLTSQVGAWNKCTIKNSITNDRSEAAEFLPQPSSFDLTP